VEHLEAAERLVEDEAELAERAVVPKLSLSRIAMPVRNLGV
jgi:hypothetical protein